MAPLRTRRVDAAPSARIDKLALKVVRGAHKGRTLDVPFEAGSLIIGHDASCELVLDDDTLSARHCEIFHDGKAWVLRDLDSTNGVHVDGVRVREAYLHAGARLQLGELELAVQDAGQQRVPVSAASRFGPLVGASPAMRALFAQLDAIAASPAPLLIEGETGTGKDVAAQAIHQASPRRDGPFVVFDCGAASGALLEGELFGYEKGAFTGATAAREGLVEAAADGTLVLDEIGELPLDLQPKLLRVIERKEVRRLGSNITRPVDVRIIACTLRSLRREAKARRFREDLYFRLSALQIRIPSLRERLLDLPALVDHLLSERGSPRRFGDLSESDQMLLQAHRWPGNVRELRNVIERLLAFPSAGASQWVEADVITLRSGSPPGSPLAPLTVAREQAGAAFERRYLVELMRVTNGSIAEATRISGVSRQFLHRILKRHGLS
jgi:DNA-binding NtrC family response regulator